MMSDYLAGMIARSEHTQMNQSRQPVLDFDRRAYVSKPGGMMQAISTLLQWLGSLRPSLSAPTQHEHTITREMPLSDNR
jgi:hypothetical protein